MARSSAGAWSPLVSDEVLVTRSQAGDVDALDLLLRRYRTLAQARARSYFLVGADADDVEQEGLIGLCKAVHSFRHDRRVSFRAFAEMCVGRQVISAVRAATRYKHSPLNQYVPIWASSADDGTAHTLEETIDDGRIPDPADVVVSREQMGIIRRSIAEGLSHLEREVLSLYVEGRSYDEIAGRLGRGTKSVDNAVQRIRRKLDARLSGRAALAA